jgi:hypothetical protein
VRSGQLVRVLEDWSPCFEGMFLYYSGHRQVPAPLRALIDMIRVPGSLPADKRTALANPFAICAPQPADAAGKDGALRPDSARLHKYLRPVEPAR